MKKIRRKVTDEEFISQFGGLNEPIENLNKQQRDNRIMMHKVTNRYSKYLTKQQIKTCMMYAIWRCLENHEEGRGNKFTTSLWRFIKWECQRELRKQFKSPNSPNIMSIGDLKNFDITSGNNDEVKNLRECIALLPEEDVKLIHEYYYDKYTMKEIAERNSYSKETARQKIKKATDKLKEMFLVRNEAVYS